MSTYNGELKRLDHGDKILEMTTSATMELNNVDVAIEEAVASQQISRQCFPITTKTKHVHLDSFVPPGGTTRKLEASGCFNFQNKFIHLAVKLLPNEDGKHCKLTVTLKTCPQDTHWKLPIREIREAFIQLNFLNHQFQTIQTKYVHLSGHAMMESKKHGCVSATDERFCTTAALHKCLQRNPKGCIRQYSHDPIPIEYEFVLLHVKLRLCLYPRQGNYKYLNSTSCSGAEQLGLKMEIPSKFCGINKIRNVAVVENTSVCDDEEHVRRSSIFADIVSFKCGASLEHTLKVHKQIFKGKSPVFDVMHSTNMLEAKDDEIEMPNVSLEVMDTFVRLVYGWDVGHLEKVEVIVGVLELVCLYQMKGLIDLLVEKLIFSRHASLSVNEAVLIYHCGYDLCLPDLQLYSLQWIAANKKYMSTAEKQLILIELLRL